MSLTPTHSNRPTTTEKAPTAHPPLTPPKLNTRICEACGRCISVCRRQVLEMRGFHVGPFKHRHAVLAHLNRCTGCGLCVKGCPAGALSR
ncbi:MAG TPA: ferredoxin family protein [Chloroflexota bacterium]|nr:ferredoxin family protein [Chloroflexota bacterium]